MAKTEKGTEKPDVGTGTEIGIGNATGMAIVRGTATKSETETETAREIVGETENEHAVTVPRRLQTATTPRAIRRGALNGAAKTLERVIAETRTSHRHRQHPRPRIPNRRRIPTRWSGRRAIARDCSGNNNVVTP